MASVHSSERTLRAESTLDSKVDASLDESTDEVLYSDKFVTLKRTALIVRYICLLQTKIIPLGDVVDIQPASRARKDGTALTLFDVHWYGLGWSFIMWGMDVRRVKNWIFAKEEAMKHIIVVQPQQGLRVGFTVVDLSAFWRAWESVMVKL